MSSEDVLLKIPITARAGWRDVDVGNDRLCISYISFYGKFFQVGIRQLNVLSSVICSADGAGVGGGDCWVF